MPDGTYRTIRFSDSYETIQAVQAQFWAAWNEYQRFLRLKLKKK